MELDGASKQELEAELAKRNAPEPEAESSTIPPTEPETPEPVATSPKPNKPRESGRREVERVVVERVEREDAPRAETESPVEGALMSLLGLAVISGVLYLYARGTPEPQPQEPSDDSLSPPEEPDTPSGLDA